MYYFKVIKTHIYSAISFSAILKYLSILSIYRLYRTIPYTFNYFVTFIYSHMIN